MGIRKIFASNLKVLRESKGLTQSHLASLCGLSQTSINKLENELSFASDKSADAIARALDIHVSRLYWSWKMESQDELEKKFNELLNKHSKIMKDIRKDILDIS